MKALAGKITAAVKPSRGISLDIKNISSLGAADVEAIRKALEAGLQSQGLMVGSGNIEINVTLSENADGYVWVAEIRRNTKREDASRVAIVSVSKAVLQR